MRAFLAIVVALFLATSALAQTPLQWQAGKHYFVIEPALPGNVPGKIEVAEVFSYGCPACNVFLPTADRIKKTLPANAILTYVPASFNTAESWPTFQRAYLTAKALGVADKAHEAMFRAIWANGELSIRDGSGKPIKREIADTARFYATYGIKAEDFIATASSFAINTQVRKADAFVRAAQVDSTPTIVVAGKYRVNGQSAGSADNLVELVKYLVGLASSGG